MTELKKTIVIKDASLGDLFAPLAYHFEPILKHFYENGGQSLSGSNPDLIPDLNLKGKTLKIKKIGYDRFRMDLWEGKKEILVSNPNLKYSEISEETKKYINAFLHSAGYTWHNYGGILLKDVYNEDNNENELHAILTNVISDTSFARIWKIIDENYGYNHCNCYGMRSYMTGSGECECTHIIEIENLKEFFHFLRGEQWREHEAKSVPLKIILDDDDEVYHCSMETCYVY